MPFERPPNLAAFLEIYLVISSSAKQTTWGEYLNYRGEREWVLVE